MFKFTRNGFPGFSKIKPKTIGILLIVAILILVMLFLVIKESWQKTDNFTRAIVPVEEEKCQTCHIGLSGFAPAHSPEKIGCVACHLGDALATKKDVAHRGMKIIPGNLSAANQTCGTGLCHPGIPQRIERSLMNTMSGIVSVDRFAFGESDSLSVLSNIREIGHSAADKHLRNLCASCHLGNEKMETGQITERSRGGGCNACHLNYDSIGHLQHLAYLKNPSEESLPKIHPALSLKVDNKHCFGCHSRSGRISTSYEGWHETKFQENVVAGKSGYRVLEDHRVFQFIKEDVHHVAGMECIDCHDVSEVMGNAKFYQHKEEAVKIRCSDCHFNELPKTVTYEELDYELKKILALRNMAFEDKKFVVGKESNRPMINIFIENEKEAVLVGKISGKKFSLSPQNPSCSKNAHKDLACSTCHTSWAPQCIGCHSTFDKKQKAFDLLDKKKTKGKWVEYLGDFFAEPPTLGIVENRRDSIEIERKIKSFAPGMIMTIDKSAFVEIPKEGQHIFHRLFAPIEPHTTIKESRTCMDCHNNSLAIGFGRGELVFSRDGKTGKWQFYPDYQLSEFDNRPQDSWIGFLENGGANPATRPNARPFNVEEQKRILTVGACLTCHDAKSKVMMKSLDDFEGLMKKISGQCVLPGWD